jgi:hypothetical protein
VGPVGAKSCGYYFKGKYLIKFEAGCQLNKKENKKISQLLAKSLPFDAVAVNGLNKKSLVKLFV